MKLNFCQRRFQVIKQVIEFFGGREWLVPDFCRLDGIVIQQSKFISHHLHGHR